MATLAAMTHRGWAWVSSALALAAVVILGIIGLVSIFSIGIGLLLAAAAAGLAVGERKHRGT